MAGFDEVYENVADYLYDHGTDYDVKALAEDLSDLDRDELNELNDLVLDDVDYDYFADWCEDHDIMYH